MTINEQKGKLRCEKTNLIQWLYDKLFPLPAVCPVCMEAQERLGICDKCRAIALRKRSLYGQCARCGSFGVCSAACRNCREWPLYYKGNIAIWPYQEAYKQVIKEFKFHNMPWLAEVLAQEMMPYLPHGYDLLVPVPLHERRQRRRGANQAETLCRLLASRLGMPVLPLLKRTGDTLSQVKLSAAMRRKNVRDAFEVTGSAEGLRILLVDDIRTTGATAQECARMLLKNGAKHVGLLTAAIAMKK